ncbi:hypothetical protein C8R45DRAFT_945416 [Mycena sanguinolenta]|nr:hypothetical protein C8R45DRAFT_945416 [Mycena sanguinolenta]
MALRQRVTYEKISRSDRRVLCAMQSCFIPSFILNPDPPLQRASSLPASRAREILNARLAACMGWRGGSRYRVRIKRGFNSILRDRMNSPSRFSSNLKTFIGADQMFALFMPIIDLWLPTKYIHELQIHSGCVPARSFCDFCGGPKSSDVCRLWTTVASILKILRCSPSERDDNHILSPGSQRCSLWLSAGVSALAPAALGPRASPVPNLSYRSPWQCPESYPDGALVYVAQNVRILRGGRRCSNLSIRQQSAGGTICTYDCVCARSSVAQYRSLGHVSSHLAHFCVSCGSLLQALTCIRASTSAVPVLRRANPRFVVGAAWPGRDSLQPSVVRK